MEAHNIWVLRTEALLRAVMPRAVAGDLRAIETCRRILQQQARYYGLYDIERDPFARWRTGPDEFPDVTALEEYRRRHWGRRDDEPRPL